MTNHDLNVIEQHLATICGYSTLFEGRHLSVDVIMNPCAGAFFPHSRLERVERDLSDFTRGLVGPVRDPRLLDVRFHQTTEPEHATGLAAHIIGERAPDVRLVVSAGGDGTHDEVLSAAVRDSRVRNELKGRLWFFRFPFGTGNDGADGDSVPAAARALMGDASFGATGHITVRPAGSPEILGFNIASAGLDAYVASLTNRLKGSIAGDMYKVLADIMTLLYEPIVGTASMVIRWEGADGSRGETAGRFMLCAFGVSGSRTYGDHKPILPGFENVCAIERVGLFRKVHIKGLVYRGSHVDDPAVHMIAARRITIEYDRRIPLQVDGETRWLAPEDFPLELELHADTVPIIQSR